MPQVEVKDARNWHFTKIENAFLDDDKSFSIYEKMVYVCICRFSNVKTGKAFPSATTISKMAGCSERKTRACISSLEEKGVISLTKRNGATSIITLNPVTPAPHAWVEDTPAPHAGGGRHTVQGTPAPHADELEKPNQRNTNEKNDELFEAFWKEYPRKKEKQAAKDAFLKRLGNKKKSERATAEEMTNGAINYAKEVKKDNSEERFIKHGATFLNKGSYRDYQENPNKSQLKAVRSVKDMSLEERIAIGKKKVKELEDQIALSDRGIIPGDDGNAIPLERAEEWLENARERLSSLQEQVRSG